MRNQNGIDLVVVRCAAALYLVVSVYTFPGLAQEGDEPPLLEEIAVEKLKRFSDYMAGLEFFTLKVVSAFDEIEPGGVRVKRFITTDIAIQRPNRMALHVVYDDGTSRNVWYKGDALVLAAPDSRKYVQIDAPGSLDELIEFMEEIVGFSPPVAYFLVSDIYRTHQSDLLSARYLGAREIDGRTLDHMSFESVGANWQIWLSEKEAPLLRRAEVEFIGTKGEPIIDVQVVEWNIEVVSTGMMFDFFAPSDWERVDLPIALPRQ